ncbi:hypothetical protein [Caldimonas brevitalea]|uniref:Uncharacterized protein n=1 Tax=Caldimonas brevitalea TaxID=413882 RepID=A0A0G3BHA6_9BURK|nr:hypothetical protein [Caldimonas brevitalea]AKJ28752.1 hypothetical protein AAW51_2061 [Caldimonas brevitalea]
MATDEQIKYWAAICGIGYGSPWQPTESQVLQFARLAQGAERQAAQYWHRECLAAREAIDLLRENCADAAEYGTGFLGVRRIEELLEHIPAATTDESDPSNYADASAVATIRARGEK